MCVWCRRISPPLLLLLLLLLGGRWAKDRAFFFGLCPAVGVVVEVVGKETPRGRPPDEERCCCCEGDGGVASSSGDTPGVGAAPTVMAGWLPAACLPVCCYCMKRVNNGLAAAKMRRYDASLPRNKSQSMGWESIDRSNISHTIPGFQCVGGVEWSSGALIRWVGIIYLCPTRSRRHHFPEGRAGEMRKKPIASDFRNLTPS